MSRRLPSLTLGGWFLAILLPMLGVLIVAYAAHVYLRLYGIIISGFDSKLVGASTLTAAFIDPADHRRLTEPLPVTSLAHVTREKALMALDVKRRTILKIRTDDGMAMDTGIHVPAGVGEICAGLKPDELFLVDGETGRFLRLNLNTGAFEKAFTVDPPIRAAATWVEKGWIYIAGRGLRRYDVLNGRLDELAAAIEPLRDLALDTRRGLLMAVSARGSELLRIDPENGVIRKRLRLRLQEPPDPDGSPRTSPVELLTIAFEPISGWLYGTSTSFVRVNADTGIVSADGFLPGFGQEQGPIYRRYAEPMHRIMDRLQLTYLYTQTVLGRNHIFYGIDGTVGAAHSPLLSQDTLPDEEAPGVQRLMTEGSVYTSGIQIWQQWGLVKSAFAPILDETGRPIAMAGADVDVTTIQFQTRRALVVTFSFGAGMLLLGGLMTFEVARRLTGPLGSIRTAALHAASNDFGRKAEVARPRELRKLAERFTAASAGLGRQVRELGQVVSTQRAARESEALVERLARISPLAASGPATEPWAWGGLGPESSGGGLLGGAVRRGDTALAWIAASAGAPPTAAARRAIIATTADALLARHGAAPAALKEALEPLFSGEVAAWALLSPEGCRVILRSGTVLRRGADGRCREVGGAAFERPLFPAPGEALVLVGPDVPSGCLDSLEFAGPAASASRLLGDWARRIPDDAAAAYALVGVPKPA